MLETNSHLSISNEQSLVIASRPLKMAEGKSFPYQAAESNIGDTCFDDWSQSNTSLASAPEDSTFHSGLVALEPFPSHEESPMFEKPDRFEEGECRDWLVLELGEIEQIPSNVRYEVGIDEVR